MNFKEVQLLLTSQTLQERSFFFWKRKERKKKKSQQGQKVEQADKNSFHEVENTYILWIKNFLHRFFKKIYFYIHWNMYMKQCTCNKKLTHQICI